MAPCTEIATLPIVAGAAIEEEGTSTYTIWQDLLNTIASQDGYQRLYWGRRIEDQSAVSLLIDWRSIDAHKAFISSPQYTPFLTKVRKILGSPAQFHHAHLDPHPPAPATSSTRAPVTECLTLYFPTTFDTSSFDSQWPLFKKALEDKAEGFRATSGGWVAEELELDGEKCKAWAGFLGWNSVEAHMKYRETEAFKGTIGGLREGTKAIKAYHAVFEEK